MPQLTADLRRALEVLANTPNGCTENVLLARGISRDVIAELIRNIRITDAGRQND